MKAIAEQCQHFSPINREITNSKETLQKGINCTMCRHYDNGSCKIKDEILTSMDQT
jgi:hypothetical protein